MRALFLFNHDAAHQAAHVAGIMGELAVSDHPHEVIAATGTPVIELQVRALISAEAAERITWKDLSLPPLKDTLLSLPNRLLPARRLARLRSAENLFASVDMVISPERTCLRVKNRLLASRNKAPLFVFVPHGAGDRAVTYHPSMAGFDHFLVSGQKVKDEMVAHNLATPENCRIIGYAKFDTVAGTPVKHLFANDNPVIIYNPHFDPHLSSWYGHGPELLRALASMGDRFNTVFAPHVMLWRKRLHISPEYRVARRRPDLPAGLDKLDHVLVDTASPALFDMTYTRAAHIYIGDVSSQIYEFLPDPGLSIFIDAAKDGPDAYPFWANGPVVQNVAGVIDALRDWEGLAGQYRETQERLFNYTMDVDPNRTASQRGAEAIVDILG